MLAVALGAGFVHAVTAQTADEPVIRSVAAGIEAYHAQDYAAAIRFLAPIVEADGDGAPHDALEALALSYYFSSDYDRAPPLLEQASAREPERAELAYPLALAHIHRRDTASARHAFARLFGLPAGSQETALLTARFLVKECFEDLAETELERLKEEGARLPQLHFLAGQLALFRGDVGRAISELQHEIAINPAFSMAYYRLGDAYVRKNEPGKAIGMLEKAIWLNPDFSSPYILLGKIHLRAKRHKAAEGMLQRAVAMDPNNRSTRYLLGLLYRQMGRTAAAKEQFEIWHRLEEPQ